MKIVRAEKVQQTFPDGTSSPVVMLEFQDGEATVFKRVSISGAAKAINASNKTLTNEARYLIMRSARDAARDIAFYFHGETWKEHVTWGQYWSPRESEAEQQLIAQAEALLVEAAHEA